MKSVYLFFVVFLIIFLSAAETINSKLKYMYVLLKCLAYWRRGKRGQEFLYILEW